MHILHLDRLLELLARVQWAMAILWLGLAMFTVGLTILLYTRWGQYKLMRKCMAMSLLAHLLLAGYAATVEIVGPALSPAVQVALGDGPDETAAPGGSASALSNVNDQPWEMFPAEPVAVPKAADLERGTADLPAEPQRLADAANAQLAGEPNLSRVGMAEVKLIRPNDEVISEAAGRSTSVEPATTIDAPPGDSLDTVTDSDRLATEAMRLKPVERVASNFGGDATISPSAPSERQTAPSIAGLVDKELSGGKNGEELAASRDTEATLPGSASRSRAHGSQPVPDAYRLRVAPNRAGIAQSHGGTAETEAAVKAALRWLADNQAADGRWDPRVHDAGRNGKVLGRERQDAGSRADTAITGLALLAFLGSGHTHRDGPYRDDVRRGLEFLMQSQAPDGNLGGHAAVFEFMYCHAMAACALSEAYGLTRDERLRESVHRAVGYTIASQDPNGGGWRYRPGDPGDTSQLGWQLMSLKSAELAGIPMPERTRQGIIRYLQSATSGKYGGIASYRPGEQPTRTMTAEALVCWQFLGIAREHPVCSEASAYIASEVPGEGVYNLYYWYYATLSMYQLQDDNWQRWNQALRTELVSRQVKDGPQAGSWDTSDLWGGHGGRVYTTALATLTLEVYYRFLPIYSTVALKGNHTR